VNHNVYRAQRIGKRRQLAMNLCPLGDIDRHGNDGPGSTRRQLSGERIKPFLPSRDQDEVRSVVSKSLGTSSANATAGSCDQDHFVL
jgi:hypothetical protein